MMQTLKGDAMYECSEGHVTAETFSKFLSAMRPIGIIVTRKVVFPKRY
jgi:hypothetical protein